MDDRPVDPKTALISAAADVMAIEDVTETSAPMPAVRLRGRLLVPADQAYSRLAERFRSLGQTPLLRKDGDGERAVLVALPGALRQATQRSGVAAGLFALTVLSCLFAGAQMTAAASESGAINWRLLDGLPFAASLLVILAAHEFGHYLMGRRLGEQVSLPYFIPMPLGPFGTLGAFINMVAPPRDRRHLLAVAVAGPLAGFVAAVPLLWLGLSLSQIQPLPLDGYQLEGNSILYAAMKYLMFGRLLPSGGQDVFIHQVAFGAWAGLLVTGLNLIPAGQLDGGHIVYALLGEKTARRVFWVVLAALAGMSFLWGGWLLWVALVFVFGRVRLAPLDDITELTRAQRVLGAAMVLVFVLVFTPIPLTLVP